MNREFIKYNGKLHRIIKEDGERSLIIDCKGTRLPQWTDKKTMESLSETEIIDSDVIKGILAIAEAELETSQTAIMNKRFTMIAAILPVIENKAERIEQIKAAAKRYGVSIVTIRTYLCRYLVSQSKNGLVIFYDESKEEEAVNEVKELTKDQKNMRWALNKFYYNTKKNSLNHAYINLLKEKYLDENGVLLEEHPSFYQFRYFFRKTRDCQNEIISRYGLHYRNDDYKKEMLNGGIGIVAYSPEDSGRVYLIEDGRYTAFTLIEQRFSNKSLDEVQDIKEQQKSLVMECREDEIKSKIDLAVKIENLLGIAKKQMGSSATDNPSIKSIRQNRKKEQERNHFDVLEEAKHV